MSESSVIDYLRAQFARVHERLETIDRRLDELTTRTARLERSVADLHVTLAEQSSRIDRIDARGARIERRLELRDEPAG